MIIYSTQIYLCFCTASAAQIDFTFQFSFAALRSTSQIIFNLLFMSYGRLSAGFIYFISLHSRRVLAYGHFVPSSARMVTPSPCRRYPSLKEN